MQDFDALLFGNEKARLHANLVDTASHHREWLRDHGGDYITATKNYEDVAWLQDAIETFRTVFERIQEFAAGEEPEYKALFLLGQAERSMATVFSQIAIIQEYEDHKDAIEHTQAILAECEDDQAE